jgi:hypothetical protein
MAAALLGAAAAPRRDLGIDESRGGHTLARHVGRTDSQLLDRLAREPRISAASTYTDRATAETVVALALERERSRVRAWRGRYGSRPNLVLHGERTARPAHRPRHAPRLAPVGRCHFRARRPALGRGAAGLLRADILSGGTRVIRRTTRSPYPQLEAFFAGYLNQDFPRRTVTSRAPSGRSPPMRARQERQALARDWQAFREEVGEDVTVTSLGRTLASRFGSAWAPRRRAEVDLLDRLIRALGSRA